ncbi:helix-turn-helix domain-containing protein [Thioalkalivibrio sp. ALE9]|uniref:helix-turn-helix domain-containing protein n=1 Tax=Thioalkalivibrio sp. ALE9 TaxID=1158169 RepID=UPI0003A6B426|nr:AraC family transcriptional regulator [Thioalkalivibrio sp. ALE9]
MPQPWPNMLEHYARGNGGPHLRETRAAASPAVAMLETRQPPGLFHTPASDDLVLSQSSGAPFRYVCDLGAGRFSGHTRTRDFVAVAPGATPWCRVTDAARVRFIAIPADLARRCLDRPADDPLDFGPVHNRHHSDPLIAQGLECLWQEMGREDPAAHVFVDSMMAALVVRLARLTSQAAPADRCRGGLAPHRSAQVIDYMQTYLDQPIRLAELAALCDLSPWHFARAFRETHGQPPHRYLTQLRLERARALLTESHASIGEIATATGYTPQQLARHFRQAFGMAPGAYRDQYGEPPITRADGPETP